MAGRVQKPKMFETGLGFAGRGAQANTTVLSSGGVSAEGAAMVIGEVVHRAVVQGSADYSDIAGRAAPGLTFVQGPLDIDRSTDFVCELSPSVRVLILRLQYRFLVSPV